MRRTTGITLALVTATISGVAVFLNSYGVASVGDATVYTTLKNVVAAVALLAVAVVAAPRESRAPSDRTTKQRAGLVAIAVIGGSVPFVLFFEGLARAGSTQAAFIHKTLIVWVAFLAVPLLKERLGPAHIAAIVLVVAGQLALQGGVAGFTLGGGEVLIALATLMWSIEIVVSKRLMPRVAPLEIARWRMGGGAILLLAYVAATGRAGDLLTLSAEGWGWVLLTGVILAAYVATWLPALAMAQAVDVTAVLVFGAVITASLQLAVNGITAPNLAVGALLIGAGVAIVSLHNGREAVVA